MSFLNGSNSLDSGGRVFSLTLALKLSIDLGSNVFLSRVPFVPFNNPHGNRNCTVYFAEYLLGVSSPTKINTFVC